MGASESKLAFKEQVFRLEREDNLPAKSPHWSQFYTLPESAEDVFALWSPNDIRGLALNRTGPEDNRPPRGTQVAPKKNLETLIYACIARLRDVQTARCYTDPHRRTAPEVLNCMRILTRLLPYVYEADHLREWEDRFFWQPRRPTRIWDTRHDRWGPWHDGLEPGRGAFDSDAIALGAPLGEDLLDLLTRYLFFPDFTLPKRYGDDGLPDPTVAYHIWSAGIGCRQSAGMSKENERNAGETIRCLLSLCSRQLYVPPHLVAERDVPALRYLTAKPERQAVLSVVCSGLNTVSFGSPLGCGAGSAARWSCSRVARGGGLEVACLPPILSLQPASQAAANASAFQVLKYNPASWRQPFDFTLADDPRTRLVNLSIQLLLVLILYPGPSSPSESNQYRKALSRLHRPEDFQFIQSGLTTALTQPVSGIPVPGLLGSKDLPWAPEMLVLFWELLQINKRFRAFIVGTERAHDFVVLVLYYAMVNKDEPGRQGLVRMCVLILQTMSVEGEFGKRLTKEFKGQETLPNVIRVRNFKGGYGDFLITVSRLSSQVRIPADWFPD
jgi:hypothetical protein